MFYLYILIFFFFRFLSMFLIIFWFFDVICSFCIGIRIFFLKLGGGGGGGVDFFLKIKNKLELF